MEAYEYLIYGAPTTNAEWQVLAHSSQFAPESAKTVFQQIPVSAFADGSGAAAMLRQDADTMLLAYALAYRVTYIRVPLADMRALKGDLRPIIRLLRSDPEHPAPLTTSTRWTFEIRREALIKALDIVGGQRAQLLAQLSGLLAPEGLAITGCPLDFAGRVYLLQGLTLLIPATLRSGVTFSMNSATPPPPQRPRIVFAQGGVGSRRLLPWGAETLAAATDAGQSYVRYLAEHWGDDLDSFMRVLTTLDNAAYQLPADDRSLAEHLDAVIQLATAPSDSQQTVSTEALIATLEGGDLDDETRQQYLKRLLQLALDERDVQASHWLASGMDADADMNAQFGIQLDEFIDTQPDAVYAFTRAHLNKGGDPARWLPRLHRSARRAFALVLESADASSIMSWLQLLAREPERYEMGEIVHDAILGAVPLAYQNPGLARDLLIRAIKREPSLLVPLLDDAEFCASLPEPVQNALFEHEVVAIELLADQSRELFLLALARALGTPAIVNMALVSALWDLYVNYSSLVVAEPYQPIALIRRLIGVDRVALQEGVLATLLDAMVEYKKDELFFEAAEVLAHEEVLMSVLVPVLRDSHRQIDDLVNIISRLSSSSILNAQETVNLYVSLLDYHQWDDKTMTPMIEQLGRLVSQPSEARVPAHALWHLVELNTGLKTDAFCKGAVRRLLNTIIEHEPDEQFVKDLVRLKKATQNQPVSRLQIQNWWRDYTNALTTPQLLKLEKTLDGQRALDDLRSSLATYIGLRKQFATRNLKEWSDDISTTYRMLKTLSEGFDPNERTGGIDIGTLQRMIETSVQEWPSDQKHILAANLRDLAELLPTMADVRTKPSLIRSDDTLERQLMTGDTPPQSAIDVMRWLAGYLDGAQKSGT